MTDRERIAELEAEVADNDAMMEIRHQRTVEADREWQQATGQHDVFPDLGALIDWLRERARQAEASEARLREALEQIRRVPTTPFPDPGAHSERAFSDAVWTAWSRMQQIASAALSGAGAGEHPDTVALQAVQDILDEQEASWCNAGAKKRVREAGVAAVRFIRSAIDALKEAR